MNAFLDIEINNGFTLENLPYGIFRSNKAENFRVGVAIGDFILDLAQLEAEKLLVVQSKEGKIFAKDSLNPFMNLGYKQWHSVRQQIQDLLRTEHLKLRHYDLLKNKMLFSQAQCELKLPIEIPDYTDFYACKYHAENLGKIFRPSNKPLSPNWKYLPVAYHGRSSSIVVSGTSIKRPRGQMLSNNDLPVFSCTNKMDFEVELGFIIGTGNQLGESITLDAVDQHIFGAVLVNDWSARDIQRWEYQPLGPFLSKSFATSISPWVVSMSALKKFMQPAPEQEIRVLDYLQEEQRKLFNIDFTVYLRSKNMPHYQEITHTNSKYLYWTHKQMVAHHTINGCNLRCGDLLATGTISGPGMKQAGSLIELTWNGQKPILLSDRTERSFLMDDDSVLIKGKCVNSQGAQIDFGAVEGTLKNAE